MVLDFGAGLGTAAASALVETAGRGADVGTAEEDALATGTGAAAGTFVTLGAVVGTRTAAVLGGAMEGVAAAAVTDLGAGLAAAWCVGT